MLQRSIRAFLACLAVFATSLAANTSQAAQLQWGFDSTSGAVSNVNNDGTGGSQLAGQMFAGRGTPNYNSDIPPAAKLQNTTGVGSVDFWQSNATVRSVGTVSDLGNQAAVVAAGGITVQAWYKRIAAPEGGSVIGAIIDVGGAVLLRETSTGFSVLVNSSGLPIGAVSMSAADREANWTHLAGIWATDGTNHTISLYVNGVLVDTKAHTQVPSLNAVATRAICVGNRFTDATLDLEGLVFEPVITLGVVPPSQFTIRIPEASTGVMSLAGLGALVMRRKR